VLEPFAIDVAALESAHTLALELPRQPLELGAGGSAFQRLHVGRKQVLDVRKCFIERDFQIKSVGQTPLPKQDRANGCVSK